MKIDKNIYNYIDHELHNYEGNKKKLQEIRANIIESSSEPTDGQPKSQHGIGSPTEKKAIKLMTCTSILAMERTIKAIDSAFKRLDNDYYKFFEWNYKKEVGIVRTCQEVGISEKTYYRWRDKIVYLVGIELGII